MDLNVFSTTNGRVVLSVMHITRKAWIAVQEKKKTVSLNSAVARYYESASKFTAIDAIIEPFHLRETIEVASPSTASR